MKNTIYEGLRVLDLSDEKGMYCGKLLAEVGMEVIKVESTEGDRARRYPPFAGGKEDPECGIFWLYHNAGKKAVTLDLETEQGRAGFKKLAATADVILETFEPGRMAAWGLGYDELKKDNADLIMLSITPFGQTGPYRDWKASSDLIPYAMAGPMFETGLPGAENEPLYTGRNLLSNAACIYGATAVLAALRGKRRNGTGAYFDLALVECCAVWRNAGLAYAQIPPSYRLLQKSGSEGPFPPDSFYRCKDGGVYFVGMSLWGVISDWMKEIGMEIGQLDEPQYKVAMNQNPDLIAHQDEARTLVAELCMHYTKDELYQEGIKRHIPICPMNSPAEISQEPQYVEREFFVEIDHPVAGKSRYPGAPAKLTGSPLEADKPAPLLGQDNAAILAPLGIEC